MCNEKEEKGFKPDSFFFFFLNFKRGVGPTQGNQSVRLGHNLI